MESHKKKLFNYPFFPLCGPDDTLYHSRVIRMSNAFSSEDLDAFRFFFEKNVLVQGTNIIYLQTAFPNVLNP